MPHASQPAAVDEPPVLSGEQTDPRLARIVLDQMTQFAGLLDPEGVVLEVNQAALRAGGLCRSDVIGQPFWHAHWWSASPEAQERLRASIRRAAAGEFVRYDAEVLASAGGTESLLIDFTLRPVRNGAGEVVYLLPEGFSIREKRAVEEALREEEERFRATFEQAAVGLAHVGLQGQWLRVNQRLCQKLDYQREELLERSFQDITHPEDLEADLDQVRRMIAGEITTYAMEKRYLRKDGTYIWANLTVSLVRDDEGEPRYFISAVQDITSRKEAEAALLSAHQQLERRVAERTADLQAANEALRGQARELARSNADLEQFAYVASHDLQEPLRMVSSYTQLLARRYQGQLDDKADRWIGYAVDGAERMQRLINDLLAYSRVGTHGRTPEPSHSELVLAEALRNLEGAIRGSGAVVTHDPLPVVRVDPAQLLQLFQNLLANAVKFRGGSAPVVHVGVRQAGEAWHFRVTDNGIGIDPEHLERIFVIFQRLHTRATYPGTGMGLAICKRIVERHGGRLWVESQPGLGSEFHFTLPV